MPSIADVDDAGPLAQDARERAERDRTARKSVVWKIRRGSSTSPRRPR